MKSITKILSIFLVVALLLGGDGCKGGEEKLTPVKVSEIKEVNGKMVAYHLGNPYLFYPVHMRYDHIMDYIDGELTDSILEQAIKKVKEAGFEAVMLYVQWENIYDGKEYDLTFFTKQFELAVKYDLKVHVVWTGSNNCGFGGYMPWQTDYEKYPSLMENGKPKLSTSDGSRTPDFSAPIYLKEEGEAIQKICDWLAENDKAHRTVAFQICDEPNNNEGGFGQWMSQFKGYADYMDKLGEVVKKSKYSMVTYTVLMSAGYNDTLDGMNFKERIKYLIDAPNIDFVGWSIYRPETSPKLKEMEQDGNLPVFIGLNPASWVTPAQALYSISNAYGYCYYQFVNYYEGDGGYYSYKIGEKAGDSVFFSRDGSEILTMPQFAGHLEVDHKEIVNMNTSIFKMDELIATNIEKNMAVFNNKAKNDFDGKKTIDGEKVYMIYKNLDKQNGPAGLMLKADDGNFYGFTTLDASFTFTSDITVTEGEYKDGKWISEKEITVTDKNFKTEGGKAYQIVIK